MARVLIVDDSNLMRRVLSSVVTQAGFEVADVAVSAEEALQKIEALRPDALLLDVHLPGMDGFTFLERLRERHAMPVIVISSRNFADIVRARGVRPQESNFAFVEKPDGVAKSLDDFRREVSVLLGQMTASPAARATASATARPAPPPQSGSSPASRSATAPGRHRLIAIGASTGGVEAVTAVLSGLQDPLPPIVIVLHMPAAYTHRFASRLATVTGHAVEEAREGEALGGGQIRVAPGSHHLRMENRNGTPVTRLFDGALVSGHKPSVDVLFHSVAEAFDRAALGVILTGMGRDGADGLLQMRRAGALTFGQSSDSCTVYGMPKAAMDLGAVERQLALRAMGPEIMRALVV